MNELWQRIQSKLLEINPDVASSFYTSEVDAAQLNAMIPTDQVDFYALWNVVDGQDSG
jgi:hypothetical protein